MVRSELTSRDPQTANQSLTNTLSLQQAQVLERKIQEQKENQIAAQIVGSVLANAVGDFAQRMRKEYDDAKTRKDLDAKQAEGKTLTESDRITLARLDREGMTSDKAIATLADPEVKARADAWAEGSLAKIALHGMVGLIEAKVAGGNGTAGALGAMTQEKLASELSVYLEGQGIAPGSADYAGLMQLGTTLAGTAIGAAASGTQGAASGATSAFVGVSNNFLGHQDQARLSKLRGKKYDELTTTEKQDLASLERADQQSDYLLGMARRGESLSETEQRQLDAYLYRYAQQDGLLAARALLEVRAPNVGNYNYAFALGKYQAEYDQKAKEAGLERSAFRARGANESLASWIANPFASRPEEESRYNQIVAEQGSSAARQDSFDMQLAQSVRDGLGLITANGYARWLTSLAASNKVVGGAALAGGFYTAGQISKGEEVRFGELVVNMTTGGAAMPLASTATIIRAATTNAFLGGVVGLTNTVATNWMYGEEKSVRNAFMDGVFYGGAGTILGIGANSLSASVMPAYIGGKPLNPAIPILLQNVGKPNPYPGYIGFTVDQALSNIPSFISSGEGDKK